jgi:hypothetical protein
LHNSIVKGLLANVAERRMAQIMSETGRFDYFGIDT